jgi:hypothetical protein
MRDVTIFENFINDEELQEARILVDKKSLNLHEAYDEIINRSWVFVEIDRAHKRTVLDNRSNILINSLDISAQNFISKIHNRINTYTNKKFDLERVYLNEQDRWQDVPLHTDTNGKPNYYTMLIYLGDITYENYDKAGGDLEIKTEKNIRVEPFTKRAVLFRSYILHQAFGPLVSDVRRISLAFRFIDHSESLPFNTYYNLPHYDRVNHIKEEHQRLWKPVVQKNNISIADTTLEDRLREDMLLKIHGGFSFGARVPCAVKLLCQSPKKPIYEKLIPIHPEFDPEFE